MKKFVVISEQNNVNNINVFDEFQRLKFLDYVDALSLQDNLKMQIIIANYRGNEGA